MSAVCIIPARGGSKRIPRKNIREFCGKPMVAWSIEVALKSDLFERVIVSTDDDEIAQVAQHYGAEIPFIRPAALADDFAGTDAVFAHALNALGIQSGEACCLYATAPFVTRDKLSEGLSTLNAHQAASAFSVTRYRYPIFRALKVNENHRMEMIWPEHRSARSQDLPEAWHDAGQFYWVDVAKYLLEGRIFSCDSVPVELPGWQVQDIDTEDDWRRAEILLTLLAAEESRA